MSSPLKTLVLLAKEKQLELESNYKVHYKQLLSCIPDDCKNKVAIENGFNSAVIFANYEAGSGVCIDPRGYILTCAHCVHENNDDHNDQENEGNAGIGVEQVIVFSSGLICVTTCIAIDFIRDCALLQITRVVKDKKKSSNNNNEARNRTFPYVKLGSGLKPREELICIGQPGRDDLESDVASKTGYPFINCSSGNFKGYVDKNLHDNTEIGKLKHNCWTYWGHSGSPLYNLQGELVGMHNSWDPDTAMRHGVPLVAIQQFLHNNLPTKQNNNTQTNNSQSVQINNSKNANNASNT